MASRSLGTLTLDLVARIGGYTQGLDKAEKEAQKRAKAIERAFDNAGAAAGAALATIAAAGVAAFAVLNRQIETIAGFQDLSDKIGDTADSIASLKLAADLSGTSFDTIASASTRLTASLAKTDDEAKGVGAAIQALGLNFQEFQSLSPVNQLDAVARAMNGFADGSEKTAVAVALFGKAGAELLPFLKDLGEEGRQLNGVTAEQIRAADEYTKSTARLKSEVEGFIQYQAAQAIPTLTAVQNEFAAIIRDQAVMEVATSALNVAMKGAIVVFQTIAVVASDLAFTLNVLGKELGAFAAQYVALWKLDFKGFRAISDAVSEDTQRARKSLDELQKRILDIGRTSYVDDEIRRLQARSGMANRAPTLPRINTSGLAGSAGGRSGSQKDPYAEAQRYLESLQKQVEKTQQLSAVEQALAEIQSGRLGKVTDLQRQQILDTAKLIDLHKEETEQIRLMREAETAIGEQVNRNNELFQQRLESLTSNTPSAILEKQREDVQFLTEAFEKGLLTEQLYLEAVTTRLDLTAEKIEKNKTLAEELGLTFTSAFEDAIVSGKNFGEILKGLEQDIIRIVTRSLVTEPLGNALTSMFKGSGGGAGNFFSNLFGNIGSFLSFDGGGFTGSGPRSGGMDGRGGYMAMLHPNETVVDHTRGQSVGGININISLPGNTNRGTADQIAKRTGIAVQNAMRRNG